MPPAKQFEATRKMASVLLDRSALLPMSAAALLPLPAAAGATRMPYMGSEQELLKIVRGPCQPKTAISQLSAVFHAIFGLEAKEVWMVLMCIAYFPADHARRAVVVLR